jgi:hypothetical protein
MLSKSDNENSHICTNSQTKFDSILGKKKLNPKISNACVVCTFREAPPQF